MNSAIKGGGIPDPDPANAANQPTGGQPTAGDDAELSPQQMLELLHTQQRRTAADLAGPTALIVFIWGVAWLVGFLALWSASGANPWFGIPGAVAASLFGVLIGGALIASVILGMFGSRGVQTADPRQGMMYGFTWAGGMIAVAVLGGALIANGLSGELASLYFPAAYSLMVGVLYMAGGALWRDRGMFIMGIWLVVLGVIAPYSGAPTNSLVMAVFGGGGFLLFALILAIYSARLRGSISRGSISRGPSSRGPSSRISTSRSHD